MLKHMEHGKVSTYNNHKCRCDACRTAKRMYQKERRERNQKGFTPDRSTFVTRVGDHGTTTGYVNWKCRCEECKAAWASYMKNYRERLATGGEIHFSHGTERGYTVFSCRCWECVLVHNRLAGDFDTEEEDD